MYAGAKDWAAKAQLGVGQCYEAQNNKDKAKEAYQYLIEHFADQKDLVQKARERLNNL